MPTRFLLLRHAETTAPNVFNGFESDVPLSELGQRQVRAVVPVLAAERPDVVVSSAMIRAVSTAQPIAAACGLPLRVEVELHERKVGQLQGKTNAEAGGLWTETLRHWREGRLDFAPPGAESYLDVQRRAVPVLERLASEHPEQTVVVVAHGHTLRVLFLSLLPGLSMASWESLGPIPNLAVTEVLYENHSWRLLRFNDLPEPVKQINGVG